MGDNQNSLWAYQDTAGFVDRPASIERAHDEIASGVFQHRAEVILELLNKCGWRGRTWKELADELGLHHGQVSGALSNLHKKRLVFALREKRDKCHIYVHDGFRYLYEDNERFDEPAKTAATENKEFLEMALAMLEKCEAEGFTPENQWDIMRLVAFIRYCQEKRRTPNGD